MRFIRKDDPLGRTLGRYAFLAITAFLLYTPSSLPAQDTPAEQIFFHAKIFTADPQNPYAEAVAIRGEQIVSVGNLPEVEKTVSPKAKRIDLNGQTLFPGFIDSHSHSIDGGLGLIAADATDKVDTLNQLPPFAAAAKKSGRGMRGDILEILGLPLEFWSHPDVLNADFSTGAYANQTRSPSRHGRPHLLGQSRSSSTRRHHRRFPEDTFPRPSAATTA